MRGFTQSDSITSKEASPLNLQKKNTFIVLLKLFLFFISVYCVFEIFHQKAIVGLMPQQIFVTVLGDINNFIPAKTLAEMATLVHIRLFFINLIFLVLLSCLNKLNNCKKFVLPVGASFYGFIFLEILFLLLLRYVSFIFVYPYIGVFFIVQLSIFFLSLFLVKKL